MSNPDAPPGESSFDLYNERTIIDGLFLGAIAYGKNSHRFTGLHKKKTNIPMIGVHLTLFIWCSYILIQKKKGRRDYLYMIYISLLFIMGNVGNGTNIKVGEDTFVNFRNFPGGPNAYFATGGGLVGLTCNVVYIINSWFQDGFLVRAFLLYLTKTLGELSNTLLSCIVFGYSSLSLGDIGSFSRGFCSSPRLVRQLPCVIVSEIHI